MFNQGNQNLIDVINLNSVSFSEKFKSDENAVLVDVRTPSEFQQGHIPNSLLIDIYSPTFADEILKMDKTKNYYLYCRSGNRSFHAGRFMLSQGFNTVYNLVNGILDWYEPLEKGMK